MGLARSLQFSALQMRECRSRSVAEPTSPASVVQQLTMGVHSSRASAPKRMPPPTLQDRRRLKLLSNAACHPLRTFGTNDICYKPVSREQTPLPLRPDKPRSGSTGEGARAVPITLTDRSQPCSNFSLTSPALCALILTVFDAATAPAEARNPDPTDRALPPRLGGLLCLLLTFIAYGRNLADTLRQHAADPRVLPWFTDVALTFHSVNLTLILARIRRGLLRAAALEERLRKFAARGQDLDPDRIRPSSPCKPRPRKKPAPRLHDPAHAPSLESPPTLEQIAAEDRRRPIGAVLVDICLDLGIVPAQMDRATREELRRAVVDYHGNL